MSKHRAIAISGLVSLLVICFGVSVGHAADQMHKHSPHSKQMDAPAKGHHQMNKHPADISKHHDLATKKASEGAKFIVRVSSKLKPVVINKMHNWDVRVISPEGGVIENAKIEISGGMPMHGHGLPTAPRVTEYLGKGKYLIEGLKFNMAGFWKLKLAIDSGQHQDNVTFSLYLK